jgi:rabenosyn-5
MYINSTVITVAFLLVGTTRSYTESFRTLRSERLERYAAETNKLVIRLGKLLIDLPADPGKRKGTLQSVMCCK